MGTHANPEFPAMEGDVVVDSSISAIISAPLGQVLDDA
jgi:hypothetical protein